MLWLKSFHIIAMVAWFAGIFYLPRLFVYHTQVISEDRMHRLFCTMERRLFWGIMTPSAILTLLLGVGLVHMMGLSFSAPPLWLSLKLALVGLLILFHCYCGLSVSRFARGQNRHSARFYKIFNELPALILLIIIPLVVIKPA